MVSTGSPRFTTVCFATIHNNNRFETKGPKITENYKKILKCAIINTRYDIKKQHSQSEMTAIPIYQLSQSQVRWPEIREEHSIRLLVYCCWATILQSVCEFQLKIVD